MIQRLQKKGFVWEWEVMIPFYLYSKLDPVSSTDSICRTRLANEWDLCDLLL
jgi:hypothetical protein